MGLVPTLKEQALIVDRLTEDFSGNPVGRTYLFTGPSGAGKKKTAHYLAQFLLCQNYPKICGQCPACLRVEKGAHESLLIIDPSQNQIRIDEARKILEFLSLQSLSRFRVIIINEAHRLNATAANSLLKVLEEPPTNSFFFLITSTPSMMLSTLRSRSLRVHFPAGPTRSSEDVDEEAIQKWSQELTRFLNEPDLLASHGWRDGLKDREVFAERLSFWMEILRDALVMQIHSAGPFFHSSLKGNLKELAVLPREKLLAAFEILLGFERDLTFNRDALLMTEEFIVEMNPTSMLK